MQELFNTLDNMPEQLQWIWLVILTAGWLALFNRHYDKHEDE